MIQENTWIESVSVKIICQENITTTCPHALFQSKFTIIKNFVEEIKQDQLQITEKEDQAISSFVQVIINYLSHKDAAKNSTLYRNALISLDNLLGVRSKYLKKEHISQKFINNLIFYFCQVCEKQDDLDKNFNSLLYPVFYLVAILIYTATDKQSSKFLIQKLFNKKFLFYLSSIQIQPGNKIQRYIAIILAFLSKNINSSSLNPLIVKKLILGNLHLAVCDKSLFHIIYAFRTIIDKQSLTISQIKKFGVLQFCLEYLSQKDCEQQITMVLQILKHILKRHQILCYRILQKGVTFILQKTYKINSKATISVLQTIIPCLSVQQKIALFDFHLEQILKTKAFQNLQILGFLINDLTETHIFQILQNQSFVFFILKCSQRLLIQQERIIYGFWQSFFQSLSLKSEDLAYKIAFLFNFQIKNSGKNYQCQKIQILINSYLKNAQQEDLIS